MNLSVSHISVFPVKSCGGWSLDGAEVADTGFKHDRDWMIVDENGQMITQRQYTKMTQIKPALSQAGIILSAEGFGSVTAPIVLKGKEFSPLVWGSKCEVVDQGEEASLWISNFLGKKAYLVRMKPDFKRKIKEKYRKSDKEIVSFNDAMPFLLISGASLEDLNSRLENKLAMSRFRPSIVISGGKAFQEETWKKIKIGSVILRATKVCTRCEVTTIDQETGEKGVEPLEELGKYRTGPKGIMFGQYFAHENFGEISVGDSIKIIS